MEYYSRYSSKRFYPKSEFTSFSRESPQSSSSQSASPRASAPKKFRKDGRDIIRAKIQQGSVVLLGCSGVSDIIQHVIENGVKIAFICSNCKAIFSPRTGGYLKTHRIKCSKSIHLDKENPHQLSEIETNEFTKLIVESLTHDSQSAAFFNSEHFISLLQYVHDLGFQYGLENAQSSKGATSSTFGPADISTVIPHHTELENIVRSCVNEKKNKFYELVKQSIDGNGGGFVVDTVTTKFLGFVFHFITDDWEYICAPIAIDETKNDVIPAKIDKILREYNLDKKHFSFVCSENGVVFPLLSKTDTPIIISATQWMEKIFEQICENPKPSSNISAKLQTSLNDLFELVENAKTIVKYVEKDGMNSLTYNAGEFDFDDCSVSKGFTIHRFMSYSDEELEAIRSHFLTQDDKPMCKIIQILYRNKLKLGIFNKMLEPFLDGIHRLEDDKSPTIHLVPGILYDYLKKLKTEKFSTQLETVLAEIISTSIEKQMDSLLSETHFYALILDPKRKNKMKDYLSKEKFLQKIKDFDKIVSEVFVESSDAKSNPTSSDFNPYESTEESSTYKTELTLYYRTNVICEESEYDILQWWKENSIQFPRLSKLARKYLSIPSSSKSVDKIFNFTVDEKSDNENIETLSNIVLYRTIEKLGI